jgi:SAM-dependent methyltransferase
MSQDKHEHWNAVYERKAVTEVSWFQPEARVSLELLDACQLPLGAAILDVGAGASTFADGVIARGYRDLSLLDLSARALEATQSRLHGTPLHCEVADVTHWQPQRRYDLWHDRAVFHFLTDAGDRAAYRAALAAALAPGAYAIIGTFALAGPERCSGLPVQRYSPESLALELRELLRPLESRAERHVTPSGAEQAFNFVRFVRV